MIWRDPDGQLTRTTTAHTLIKSISPTPQHLYAYAEGNPVNFVDPLGLDASFSACLKHCIADQFGITTVLGLTARITGADIIPYPRKGIGGPGGSKATSIASMYLRKIPWLKKRLPKKLRWAPTRALGISRVGTWGKFIGRWVPWVGTALLVYDGVKIYECLEDCTKNMCKEEEDPVR